VAASGKSLIQQGSGDQASWPLVARLRPEILPGQGAYVFEMEEKVCGAFRGRKGYDTDWHCQGFAILEGPLYTDPGVFCQTERV
jgi:hypothetical protein